MDANECFDNISSLLLSKKSKDLNAVESKRFTEAWKNLVLCEGFSDRAEALLYNCYSSCGASPLYQYLASSEKCLDELLCFYCGKLYRVNSTKTSSLLFHLLALFLNSSNGSSENLDMISSLLDHIPPALKNKEKKLDGNAGVILRKWFLSKLDPSVNLPSFAILQEHGLHKFMIDDFANVINQIMTKEKNFKTCSPTVAQNAVNVQQWLNGMVELAHSGESEDKSSVADDKKPESEATKTEKQSGKKREQDSGDIELRELRQKIDSLQEEKQNLSNQLSSCQGELQRCQRRLAQKSLTLKDTEQKLAETIQADILKDKQIANLETAVQKHRDEAEKALEMVEILRRDKDKQSDETVKRIASRLRTYYMDYKDAISLEMSTDLGENMRDQLGEVFKILQDAGIIMK